MKIEKHQRELRNGAEFHKRYINYSRLIYICRIYVNILLLNASGTIYIHRYNNSRIIN